MYTEKCKFLNSATHQSTHGSGHPSNRNTFLVVGVDVEVAGPASPIAWGVAGRSCHRQAPKEQAGHQASKNRFRPHDDGRIRNGMGDDKEGRREKDGARKLADEKQIFPTRKRASFILWNCL